MALLEIEDLSVRFTQYTKGMRQSTIQVLHELRLSIHAGEIVTVFGSSGSGKSLLAHAVLGILPGNASSTGTIRFGREPLTPERQAKLRGNQISLVPQSVSYLDPLMRIGNQVRQSVKAGDPVLKQREVFDRYRLKRETENYFPFQLSGGMARRVLVSTAVVSGAKLIIADEPTPGLDPVIVGEALGCLRELADQGCAVMLISHDIESALTVSDRVAVMYAGRVVEQCPAEDFSGSGERLRHPYTQALWRSLPQNDFTPLPGSQPSADALPEGCVFAPRCSAATRECLGAVPAMREVRGGLVRCIYAS
ncbi:ABC transporter ATP-binding protein [Paenibacillus silviterrae]|uniref:ABC transporter ATP-binding protein n=1 Tax=Paenibacillus silviterrae TaxID=3242194 RepID=UPI0025435D55|nr:ABC transporter ATP-binding protein [Paenibacillus chinjuensis]